jgi:hypothetical protein
MLSKRRPQGRLAFPFPNSLKPRHQIVASGKRASRGSPGTNRTSHILHAHAADGQPEALRSRMDRPISPRKTVDVTPSPRHAWLSTAMSGSMESEHAGTAAQAVSEETCIGGPMRYARAWPSASIEAIIPTIRHRTRIVMLANPTSLDLIGIHLGTDKSRLRQDYLRHYERMMMGFRDRPITNWMETSRPWRNWQARGRVRSRCSILPNISAATAGLSLMLLP